MPKTLPDDPVDAFDTEDGLPPYSSGLTKREHFAIEALKGLLADGDVETSAQGKRITCSRAVSYADMLIEELNQ